MSARTLWRRRPTVKAIEDDGEISDLRHLRMRIWLAWLVAFYAVWCALSFGLHDWYEATLHWPIAAAMTGVGIDRILYVLLILRHLMDLKASAPTSVIVMAASSVMGTALHLYIGDLSREAFYNWLAASPVVILKALLGAFFCSIIPRTATLCFVATLRLLQFFRTLREVGPSGGPWVFVPFNLLVAMAAFTFPCRIGKARQAGVRAPA